MIKKLFKNIKEIFDKKLFFFILGNFIIAIGDAFFLIPKQIITGGCDGIAIIINSYFSKQQNNVDLIMLILYLITSLLAFFFLDLKFLLKSLIATFTFPFFLYFFKIYFY